MAHRTKRGYTCKVTGSKVKCLFHKGKGKKGPGRKFKRKAR